VKRVVSACVEETQKFETEDEYQAYMSKLEHKKAKYKIFDKQTHSDNTVTVKMIRSHGAYPIGDYLE
jgi:hypothetical protein